METQFVQGIVQKFFTLGEDQLVLMQRKTKDTKFVCRFGKGEHRSLVEGEDKKFDGMVKATDPYKEFDTYDFVGVQARKSNEVYVKSEKTSEGAEVRTEVTTHVPDIKTAQWTDEKGIPHCVPTYGEAVLIATAATSVAIAMNIFDKNDMDPFYAARRLHMKKIHEEACALMRETEK